MHSLLESQLRKAPANELLLTGRATRQREQYATEAGGTARRLTVVASQESQPRIFSPLAMRALDETPAAATYARFPLENRIVENEHGLFVPRSIFGATESIRYDVGELHSGQTCVLVYEFPAAQRSRTETRTRDEELRWLSSHSHEFAGRWIALQGPELVGVGQSAIEALKAARAVGHQHPLLVHVGTDDLPFGGW